MVRSRGNLDMYKANRQIAIDQQHNEVLSNIHLVFYELYYPAVSSYRDLIWLTTSFRNSSKTVLITGTLKRVLGLVLAPVLRSVLWTSSRTRKSVQDWYWKISRYSIPSLYAVRQWPTQFPTSIWLISGDIEGMTCFKSTRKIFQKRADVYKVRILWINTWLHMYYSRIFSLSFFGKQSLGGDESALSSLTFLSRVMIREFIITAILIPWCTSSFPTIFILIEFFIVQIFFSEIMHHQ